MSKLVSTDGTAEIISATVEKPNTGGVATAVPSIETSTSKTKMAMVGAMLTAEGHLYSRENGRTYPLHWHKLSVVVIMTMFTNILEPLARAHYRSIGIRDLQNAAEVQRMNEIISSAAYEALTTMFTVLFNKAARYTGTAMVYFGSIPLPNNTAFPAYMTSLINSIGPIQFAQLPSRGVHIPYITQDDLTNAMPATFATHHVAALIEGFEKAKTVALASVDVHTLASSAWWTFHVYTDIAARNVTHYSLWSPVVFDDVELHLSIGCLFARNRLTTDIGVINFSASEWHDTGRNDPRLSDFPQTIWNYPNFVDNQPAYRTVIEQREDHDVVMAPAIASSASTSSTQAAGIAAQKRRHIEGPGEDGESFPHRVVFHYFDHIHAESLSSMAIDRWSTMLNAL